WKGKRVRVHLEIRWNVSSSGFGSCSVPLLGCVWCGYCVREHADTQIQQENRNQNPTGPSKSHHLNDNATRKRTTGDECLQQAAGHPNRHHWPEVWCRR